MKSYRTPLLKEFPEVPPSGRRERIVPRLLAFCLALIAVVPVVILVRWEILPDWGPGWVCYRVHDYVFLPVKGWLLNRRFPYSLVGWLLTLVVAGGVATSLLLDRSFVLGPHRRLLHWLFARPFPIGAYLALQGTLGLDRIGFRSRLLRRAIHHEWVLICDRLLRSPLDSGQTARCDQLARVTNWMVRIESSLGEAKPPLLLSRWHWAYVLIRLQAVSCALQGESNWQARCERAADRILSTAPDVLSDFAALDVASTPTPPLGGAPMSEQALSRDLCLLLYPHLLAADGSASPLLTACPGLSETAAELDQKALIAHVADSIDQRRFRLHAIALLLHRALRRPADDTGSETLDLLPDQPCIWQLALSVAVHAALDAGTYRLGRVFFEAQDATILALSLNRSRYAPGEGDRYELMVSFPRQQHYAVAAALRWLCLEAEESALDDLHISDETLIDEPDRTLAQLSLQSLLRATGPTSSSRESL